MPTLKRQKWTKRELKDLLVDIDHWTAEARRSGEDDELLEEAGRAIRGYLKRGAVPRNMDLPTLIDDLDSYRDGQMDQLGRWLTDIMNALESLE